MRAVGILMVNLPESVAAAATAMGRSGVTKMAESVLTAVVSIVSSWVPVGKTALPTDAPRTSLVSTLYLLAVTCPVVMILPNSSRVVAPLLKLKIPVRELISLARSSNLRRPTVRVPAILVSVRSVGPETES